MKTLIPAAIRCSLMFLVVAALSLAYPTSVQAGPTTYAYTGPLFTTAILPYTTSDFVSGMITLAQPIGSFCTDCELHPIAFSFTDGVQTITNSTPGVTTFFGHFFTGPEDTIFAWDVELTTNPFSGIISDHSPVSGSPLDSGAIFNPRAFGFATGFVDPSAWRKVPDAGSPLSLMTLTLMALGLVARRFQRAAA